MTRRSLSSNRRAVAVVSILIVAVGTIFVGVGAATVHWSADGSPIGPNPASAAIMHSASGAAPDGSAFMRDDPDAKSDEAERQEADVRAVDSCTVIDEAGQYELTDDVGDTPDDVCIAIRADDVVLEGNGYTVEGGGVDGSVGVQINDPDTEAEVGNVTIRNLRVRNWGLGVELGSAHLYPAEARLENVTAIENEGPGVFLARASGSALENVTAERNGESGLTLWETSNVTFHRITASANGGHGLDLWDNVHDSEFDDVFATDNDDAGVFMGVSVTGNELSNLSVEDNAGEGISSHDSWANTVRDSTVENNGGTGIGVRDGSEFLLRNVTVRNNDGRQVDANAFFSDLSASDLRIGDAATFEFDGESPALDATGRNALPRLPDRARSVGDGVTVSRIDDAGLVLEYDRDAVEGDEVELWHHDGDEWHVEATLDAAEAAGTIEVDISADGIYVPVETE